MSGPDLLGMVATAYGVAAAGAALLQARQILRRGSSCEVSARFFATYTGGYAIWLLYGLSIGSVPLVLVDAAGLLCGLITLTVTLRLRGSLARPSTWRNCSNRATSAIDAASPTGQGAAGERPLARAGAAARRRRDRPQLRERGPDAGGTRVGIAPATPLPDTTT